MATEIQGYTKKKSAYYQTNNILNSYFPSSKCLILTVSLDKELLVLLPVSRWENKGALASQNMYQYHSAYIIMASAKVHIHMLP